RDSNPGLWRSYKESGPRESKLSPSLHARLPFGKFFSKFLSCLFVAGRHPLGAVEMPAQIEQFAAHLLGRQAEEVTHGNGPNHRAPEKTFGFRVVLRRGLPLPG